MSQKAYQSIMDANINATQLLQEEKYQQGYLILKKIETTLLQEKQAPTIPLSQINHLLSVVTNNIGCFYYMVDKYQAAEKYLKQSIQYLTQSIQDETLLITLINLVILFIKNEKYQEANTYIEQSFTELNQLQDQQLNPKIRLFLGDHQSIMTLQSLEAILQFYSGLAFHHLGENKNAGSAWKKAIEILKNNPKSPYYILTKAKLQNLEAEDVSQKNRSLYSSRQHLKSDRISQILQAYSNDERSNQQSFRLLSQKIKRKIGNQLSEHQNPSWYQQQNQNKVEHNEKKIEINNYFTDQKKIQLQINVKDLLQHKNITQRDKQIVKKRPTHHLEIIEKLNKTHNDIYKSYLAQRSSNNGSKTQRGDSRDLDIRIKIHDKSTQSALLQTLINKSNEKKKSAEPRDSPDICYSPQQFYNMIQKTSNNNPINSQLLRSGSQGNISNCSPQKMSYLQQINKKKYNNITAYDQAKTHRPMSDAYNQTLKGLQEKDKQKIQTIQVEQQRIQKLCDIAKSARNRLQIMTNLLTQQANEEQQLINQLAIEFKSDDDNILNDSVETIQFLD